ncbi:MAG: flagellar hook-length control protein FliK [bacterium]|nr:flagellar hook-length control protein FliK [bacterium]
MSSVTTVSEQHQNRATTAGADKRADERNNEQGLGDTAQAFIALFHNMLQRVSVSQVPEAGWANIGENQNAAKENSVTPQDDKNSDTQIALRENRNAKQEVKTNEKSKNNKATSTDTTNEEVVTDQAEESLTSTDRMARNVEKDGRDQKSTQTSESNSMAQVDSGKSQHKRAESAVVEQLAIAEALDSQLAVNDKPEVVKSATTAKEVGKVSTEKPDTKVELFMSEFAQTGIEVAGAPEFSLTQGAKTPFAGEGRSAMQLTAQLAEVLNGRMVQAAMTDNGANTGGDTGAKGFAAFSNMKELASSAGKTVAKAALAHQSSQLEAINQIKDMLVSAARNKGGTSMVVRLDPPELGNVTLKVTQRSDQLHARISAENSDVEDSLRQRVPEIMQLLSSVGFKAENIVVSFGAESSAGATINLATDAGAGGFLSGNSSEQNNNSERGGAKNSPMTAIASAAMNTAADGVPGWIA